VRGLNEWVQVLVLLSLVCTESGRLSFNRVETIFHYARPFSSKLEEMVQGRDGHQVSSNGLSFELQFMIYFEMVRLV
jgi:hypothetical protein